MLRHLSRIAALFVLALALSSCAEPMAAGSRTYVGFSLDIRSAPPPPRIVFEGEPRRFIVPGSYVYVVEAPNDDCDMFQYGGTWYVYYSGYWYASNRYDGGYAAVSARRVPSAVLDVPPGHWRHFPGHGRGRGRGHDREERS